MIYRIDVRTTPPARGGEAAGDPLGGAPPPPPRRKIPPLISPTAARPTPPAGGGGAGVDPLGEAARHQIAEFGTNVGSISTRRVYLVDTDADRAQVERVARELLADPVV